MSNSVTVDARFGKPGPLLPVALQYRMRVRGGRWQISDVVSDGVSFAMTYRSNFAREIRRIGLQGPIYHLVVKNREHQPQRSPS